MAWALCVAMTQVDSGGLPHVPTAGKRERQNHEIELRLGFDWLYLRPPDRPVWSFARGRRRQKEPERVKAPATSHMSSWRSFWGIKADDGKQYDPLASLPKEFRKDGLKVRFEATVEKGVASFHQWGKIIKIEKIEKIEKAE